VTRAGQRRALAGLVGAAVLIAGCGTGSPPPAAGTSYAGPASVPRHPRLEPCSPPAGPADLASLRLLCLADSGPSTVDPARLGSRPVLVNVWASWCVPCQEEMPALQRAHHVAGTSVAFLGIDTKDETNSALDFLAAFHVTYPQAKDPDGRLLAALHGAGLPDTVVLDRHGRVVWRKLGRLRDGDLRQALAAGLRS